MHVVNTVSLRAEGLPGGVGYNEYKEDGSSRCVRLQCDVQEIIYKPKEFFDKLRGLSA